METLSFSKANTFTTCAMKYKHVYVDKVKRPPASKMLFGTANHSVQEFAFKEKLDNGERPKVSVQHEYFVDALDKAIERDGIEYDEGDCRNKMQQDGLQTIEDYDPIARPITPILTEHPFKIEFSNVGWILTGRIDLIAEPLKEGGKKTIIDFKFGKKRIDTYDPKIQLQGSIYSIASKAEELTSDCDLQIHSVRRNARKDKVETLDIIRTMTDAEVLGHFGTVAKSILMAEKADCFPRAMNDQICSWCQYRDLCGLPIVIK